jgi:hypothetical protein
MFWQYYKSSSPMDMKTGKCVQPEKDERPRPASVRTGKGRATKFFAAA